MWRRNAAGVDSVQAQGTVGCRAGIVGVDGDHYGYVALEGMALESLPRQRQQDARGSSEIVAYTIRYVYTQCVRNIL